MLINCTSELRCSDRPVGVTAGAGVYPRSHWGSCRNTPTDSHPLWGPQIVTWCHVFKSKSLPHQVGLKVTQQTPSNGEKMWLGVCLQGYRPISLNTAKVQRLEAQSAVKEKCVFKSPEHVASPLLYRETPTLCFTHGGWRDWRAH